MNLRETHIIGEQTRERMLSADVYTPLSRLGLQFIGFSTADRHFRFVRLNPDFMQLLVCLDGCGLAWTEGGWTEIRAGCAYLTPPHTPHAYHTGDCETWSTCWIHASPEWYRRTVHRTAEPKILEVDAGSLVQAMDSLVRESMERENTLALTHWAALVECYLSLAVERPAADARLARLFGEVASKPAYNWALDELAGGAGISSEHLRRLCIAQYGHSPMRQVALLRMRHAASLLAAKSSYSVARVAEEVGYDNPFAFSTAFKRIMGRAPRRSSQGRTTK